MNPLAIARVGTAALGVGSALLGRGRRPSIQPALARFRGAQPARYLDTADQAMIDRARTRSNETIGVGAGQARSEAALRMLRRGVGGAAGEQIQSDITGQELLAKQQSEAGINDLAYQTGNRNQDFERQKLFTSFGAEIGDASRAGAQYDAQQSTQMNALLELLPNLYNLPRKTK